jgi:outer membrane protein TolC
LLRRPPFHPTFGTVVALSTTIVLLIVGRPVALEEAYRRARDRAEVVREADERVVEAEINVGRAWALVKPQLSAGYAFTHVEPRPPPFQIPGIPNFQSDAIKAACTSAAINQDCITAIYGAFVDAANAPPQRFDFFRANTSLVNATLTWNLLNGRAIPLIQNAYDSVALEKDRQAATLLDLLLAVARAYYAAAATKDGIQAAHRARDRAQRELELVQHQAALGESAGSRLRTAKIALAQAETDEKRADNAHAQSLLALKLLLRADDLEDIEPPPRPVRPDGALDVLEKTSIEKREDYRAAVTALGIAERSETEVWWRFAPTLGLFGGYRWSNVAGISGQTSQWSVGLNATMLLYDGGLRYQDLKEAESKTRLANDALDALRARLRSDVERAHLRLEAADMGVARAKDALLLAKERSEIVRAQYEVGALRGIEMKEASDAVLDAELAIIQADLEASVAILELQRAIGEFRP